MSQYMVPVLECKDCKRKWAGDTAREDCCYCGSKNIQRFYVDQGGEWENSPEVRAYQAWKDAQE